jgi:hypothetical protein
MQVLPSISKRRAPEVKPDIKPLGQQLRELFLRKIKSNAVPSIKRFSMKEQWCKGIIA